MKRLLLIICAIIPIITWAQDDAKYLEPIPVVDGKIEFSAQLNAPTLSQQELYDEMYKWVDKRFKPDGKMNARIVYTDKDKGQIVVMGEEYIVFKSSALSLDRSRIYYQMNIICAPEKIGIEMSKIRYWYDEERNGGERYKAEDWISDKFCLNKSKTKLLPISGKFRRKTIDLKDDLISQAENKIGNLLLAKNNVVNTAPKVTVSSSNSNNSIQVVPVVSEKATEMPKVDISANKETSQTDGINSSSRESIIASANRITITSGNDEQFEIGKESWGGFSKLFGKDVTFCLIDSQKTMANMLLSQNDKYTISFYIPEKSDAALKINCKKMSMQSVSGEEANKMNTDNSSTKKYNMYVGEILK